MNSPHREPDDFSRKPAVREMVAPLRAAIGAAIKAADAQPVSADASALALARETADRLTAPQLAGVPADVRHLLSDEAAQAVLYSAVAFGNATSDWQRCAELLSTAGSLASSPETEARIARNLVTVRGNLAMFAGLEPVKEAPTLTSVNGIGFHMYGRTDVDPASSAYTTTYYFILVALPLIPICRYRVIRSGNSYRFLGKAPLRTFDWVHLAVVCFLVLLLVAKGIASG